MAGHSKWSKIKRQKKAEDQARGRLFSKLGREIAVSARDGGGDPDFNPRLRTAIDTAKAENMPAENIERAIKRGTGDLPGVAYEEATYEGYGPGGAALYIECVTDNTNRTVAELRHLIDKAGGNLGTAGSVAWMFERKGQIAVDATRYDEESLLEAALAAGAEDLESDEDEHVISTSVQDFHTVQDALKEQGIEWERAELAMLPTSTMPVAGGDATKLVRLVGDLEDHDDVMNLYTNFEVDDAVLEALAPQQASD